MAFVKTKPKLRAGRNVTDTVAMGVYLADGKSLDRKSVVFRFSGSVLDTLGWQPTNDTVMRVIVLEGTDTDIGFLQLVPDTSGYAVTGKGKSTNLSRGISIGIDRFQHYVLNEPGAVPSATVQYVIEGDTLLVECPDWLRFNPQSVPQPRAEPPPVGAPQRTHVPRETFEELMRATTDVPVRPQPKLVASNASAGAVPMHVRGKGRKHVR